MDFLFLLFSPTGGYRIYLIYKHRYCNRYDIPKDLSLLGIKKYIESNKIKGYKSSRKYYIDIFGEIDGEFEFQKRRRNSNSGRIGSICQRAGRSSQLDDKRKEIKKSCPQPPNGGFKFPFRG